MELFRLAYNSSVAGSLTKPDLKQILATSVLHNQPANVTGALCFSRGTFLQVLEGDRYKLNKTFQRIERDTRHEDVFLIGLEPIQSRQFGNWAMAFIDDSKDTQSIIMKHCGVDKLMLDYMNLTATVALVREMLGHADPAP